MLIYSCSMCSLTQDVDSVPDDKRLIHWLCYTYKPFGESLADKPQQIYLCRDCWKSIQRHIEEQRLYFTAMAEQAKKYELEQQEKMDLLDGHDCHASPEDGCSCMSIIDGIDDNAA